MKHQEWSLYPAILAIAIVGLFAFGVPRSALVYAAFILACPLIMIFMRGNVVATAERATTPKATASASLPAGGGPVRKSS